MKIMNEAIKLNSILIRGTICYFFFKIIFLIIHYLNKCKYLILRVLLSILFIFLDLDRSMSTVQVLMIYVEDD